MRWHEGRHPPARSRVAVLHPDAVAAASLPVGCTVAVPVRPHAAATLVGGTSTLVGSRAR
jgi:hypothetical protein